MSTDASTETAAQGKAAPSLRHNWIIIWVIFLQWLIGYFDKTAISVAAVPIAKEFHLNPTQTGVVLSAFFMGFATMTLFGGYLADRFGARKVLLTVMLLWSLFTGLTGLAWSLASLVVLRAIFGAAEGSFPPASSAAVAELMPLDRRGRAKSLLVSGAALGTAIGSLLVAAVASSLGWRVAFWAFCIAGIVLSVVFMALSKSMRRHNGPAAPQAPKIPVRAVLRSSLVWKLTIMQFGVGIFAWGMSSWLPTYWVKAKGLELTTAGLATAIPNFVAFFAMIGAGYAADRLLRGKEGRTVAVLMAISVAAVWLTYTADSVPLGVTFISIAQVAVSACAPLISIIILNRMTRSVAGTATGIANFGQQFAGVIAPTVMGYLIQITGGSYLGMFAIVIGVMVVSLALALTSDRGGLKGLAIEDEEALPAS
jgi:MFS family permease